MTNRRPGVGGGAEIEVQSSSDRSSTASRSPRQTGRPLAPQAKLQEHAEQLAWAAYCHAIALQWAEPSAETAVIRRAVFKVWEHAFLADERGAA